MPALMRMIAAKSALRFSVCYSRWSCGSGTVLALARAAVIEKLDPRFQTLPLGSLLTMHMIERSLVQDRPDEINFGRGDDPERQKWLGQRT